MIDWSPDTMKTRVKFFVSDTWGEVEEQINTFLTETPRIKKVNDIKIEEWCTAMVSYEVYND